MHLQPGIWGIINVHYNRFRVFIFSNSLCERKEIDARVRINLFLDKTQLSPGSAGCNAEVSSAQIQSTDLICLGLHSNNMGLEPVVVWYPGLLFEEGTFFFGQTVQAPVQGQGGAQLN
jgi:hypothetical protein